MAKQINHNPKLEVYVFVHNPGKILRAARTCDEVHIKTMIHDICRDIITNSGINRFVETGTFVGETISIVCDWVCDFDPKFGIISEKITTEHFKPYFSRGVIYYPVFKDSQSDAKVKIYSIDIDTGKQQILKNIFSTNPNINVVDAASEKFIKNAIDAGEFSDHDNFMFYLDAHWGEHSSLRDEIRQVLRLKRSVIVIDDFIVPRHPFQLFEVFGTTPCGWYYINDLFKNVKIDVFYPQKGNRDHRGSVFIFVGYSKDEIAFMKRLPCFKPLIFKGSPLITLSAKLLIISLVYTGLYPHLLRIYYRWKWGKSIPEFLHKQPIAKSNKLGGNIVGNNQDKSGRGSVN